MIPFTRSSGCQRNIYRSLNKPLPLILSIIYQLYDIKVWYDGEQLGNPLLIMWPAYANGNLAPPSRLPFKPAISASPHNSHGNGP